MAPDVGVETRQADGQWVISSVTHGGLADQAGLRAGDVVLALDGSPPGERRLTSPSLSTRDVRLWRIARDGAVLDIGTDSTNAPPATRLEPFLLLVLALGFWGSA